MTLRPGSRLGPFEIQSLLGAGGMGEVYKARDTRLNRVVAVKVLLADVAADPHLRQRFEHEAKAISSLNHPHICALHDVGREGDVDYLVMEYLDGEALADRIARGPLPITEAVQIATEIADALEAAHDRDIVHRDLKPANVRITSSGTVKVLDFGLARMNASAGSSPNASTVITTNPGTILGTVAYMSPEQATGGPADRSADAWAFGCVLFEMLTGRRPFDGTTATEVIGNVLRTEPDWRRLPSGTPDAVQRVLRRSLEKDQKRRLRDMRDVRLELSDRESVASKTSPQPVQSRRREVVGALVIAVLGSVVGGAAVWMRRAPDASELRLEINTPPTRNTSLAISPDGLRIVFGATSQLWIRSLDSQLAKPLPGTEGGAAPFWSPDSRSVGFFASGKVKRIDIDGAAGQTLASSILPMGGAWNRTGSIVYASPPGEPLRRIPEAGGEPMDVTELEQPQQRQHSSPVFLPDDRHFLFFVDGSPEARGVYVGQVTGGQQKRLFNADAPAVYSPLGYLLFVRGTTLHAQRFDPDRLEPTGPLLQVADQVNASTTLAASTSGPIAYRTRPPESGRRRLTWVNRSGASTEEVVYEDVASQGPALSHDGRQVALFRHLDGNMDVWSYDTEHRTWDRITFDSADDIFPLWSNDSRRLVFGSNRNKKMALFVKNLSTAPGTEEPLLSTLQSIFPMDWSQDGRFLLYDSIDPRRGWDVWALPMDGRRTPFEVVRTDFNERLAQYSPDGKWVAYQSDRTGRSEVYVRPFPGPGADLPVSLGGGGQVRWRPDGKELFYIAADDRLMAVPIGRDPGGTALEIGTPAALFATTVGSTAINNNRHQYVVCPDGRSFVMNSVVEGVDASPVTVILNWRPPSSK